jgi:hypothetical protein
VNGLKGIAIGLGGHRLSNVLFVPTAKHVDRRYDAGQVADMLDWRPAELLFRRLCTIRLRAQRTRTAQRPLPRFPVSIHKPLVSCLVKQNNTPPRQRSDSLLGLILALKQDYLRALAFQSLSTPLFAFSYLARTIWIDRFPALPGV